MQNNDKTLKFRIQIILIDFYKKGINVADLEMSSSEDVATKKGNINIQSNVKPVELSLNQLTREQLASLSKEELIELLTNSTRPKQEPKRRRSKSPRKPPKSKKRNNFSKGIMVKTKSQSHLEETRITSIAHYTNPNDSQSEQPSEQRNRNILKNPLPPEQEERETPKSEPESSDDQRKLRARAKTTNDALLSSTDAFDYNPPKIRTQDPVIFDDISALERSVVSRSDDEDENFDSITSTNESQVIITTNPMGTPSENIKNEELKITKENEGKDKKDENSLSTPATSVIQTGTIKSKSKSKSSRITKKKLSASQPNKNLKKLNKSPKRKQKEFYNEELKQPVEPVAQKETSKETDIQIQNKETQETNKEAKEQEEPKATSSKAEIKKEISDKNIQNSDDDDDGEEDEEDDSYDVDDEVEKAKTPKNKSEKQNLKSYPQKSVQHLLEMVGGIAVSDEKIQEAKEKVELDFFVTRESDDPRRYLEIGKQLQLSKEMLLVCLLLLIYLFDCFFVC